MKTMLTKIARFEFRFPLWEFAIIVASVTVINALWHNPPWWVFVCLGLLLGVTEKSAQSIMRRWMSRSPSPKP